MVAESAFSDIVTIDLTGTGNNTLTLGLRDLVHSSTTSNFLTVEGDAGVRWSST